MGWFVDVVWYVVMVGVWCECVFFGCWMCVLFWCCEVVYFDWDCVEIVSCWCGVVRVDDLWGFGGVGVDGVGVVDGILVFVLCF